MNRLVILGVAIIAALYILVASIYIVNEREQAIAMRFGQITDVRSEPGLYFKIPTNVIDTVQIIEDRLLRYDVANMTLQVRGGKFYLVDAFLTYRISDPLYRKSIRVSIGHVLTMPWARSDPRNPGNSGGWPGDLERRRAGHVIRYRWGQCCGQGAAVSGVLLDDPLASRD